MEQGQVSAIEWHEKLRDEKLRDMIKMDKSVLLKEWEELSEEKQSLVSTIETLPHGEDIKRRLNENLKVAAKIKMLREEVAKLEENESSKKCTHCSPEMEQGIHCSPEMEQGEGQDSAIAAIESFEKLRDEILALTDECNTYNAHKSDLLKEWNELLEAHKSLTSNMKDIYRKDIERRKEENAKLAATIETLEAEVAKRKKDESSKKFKT